jgi:hypothetical protein
MSAFIVTDDTIHAIVTYALENVSTCKRMTKAGTAGREFRDLRGYSPDAIGQALLTENYRSVNDRYNENKRAPRYTYRETRIGCVGYDSDRNPIVRRLTAVDVMKLCRCLDYQSCEHDGWERSWARDFLDRVILAAISDVPGYDNAPWGLYDRAA